MFIRYKASYDCDKLSDEQKVAIQASLDHTITLICGRAGVGKTAIIKEIVYNLSLRNLKFILTSFTGKAVDNVRSITNCKAKTIHRLIYDSKAKNEKINTDCLIIDESSMVTTELFNQLINCFGDVYQIIFVGDINQLQPIEAGNLFYEMLKSKTLPTYYLTKNYRSTDGILSNAINVINNCPIINNDHFNIIEGDLYTVFDIVKGCYQAGISAKDLTIICPYNDVLKVLNDGYQSIYNSNLGVMDDTGRTFKVNDRVLLRKNIHKFKIFNGSEGIVTSINNDYITVNFNNVYHKFNLKFIKKEVNEDDDIEEDDNLNVGKLLHAYAITVDKSQGSQYPYVIGFLPNNKVSDFINKNRLYTLITRAATMLWIVTSSNKLLFNSLLKLPPIRHDNLSQRLIKN